jgi:hypothetical protein
LILLIKLILAHLCGDFLFQPDRWISEKEIKKHRSPKLYFHVLIHGFLTFLLVWDLAFWLPLCIIILTHYFIDLSKVAFQKPHNRKIWFALDQLLHLTVIFLIWFWWEQPSLSLASVKWETVLLFMTAFIFLTSPVSVIIKTAIAQWTPATIHTLDASLPDAGKFIGILERILVFIFVINHHWEAVGFLLAAKSVFRFGNLQESHDRKLTEYVLIGTLLSFGIALAVALLFSALRGIQF